MGPSPENTLRALYSGSTAGLTPSERGREWEDWCEAVADGSTILGLAEWLAFRDEQERAEMHEEAHALRRAREARTACRHCGRAIVPTAYGTWQDADNPGYEVCDLADEDGPEHTPSDRAR
jgi:hypothetical protein